MIRCRKHVIIAALDLNLSNPLYRRSQWSRYSTSHSKNHEATSEEEIANARSWLASFNPESIPRNICDVSFSRSSGPGGQKVNKTSSKATLRVPLKSILQLAPPALHGGIRESRFCASRSESLVIQADSSRKQADNVQECFKKLHHIILDVGKSVVTGETSAQQKGRVKTLQKAANESRLRLKKANSSKKSARIGGGQSGL